MKNFPNAFVIILGVIVLAWITTFIIPKGEFERIVDPDNGRTSVIENSYHLVNKDNLNVVSLLMAIPKGITERTETILLILFTGGCFYIIEKTGALSESLSQLVIILKGKEKLSLIIVAALFMAGGITIGLQEEIIAMTPILLVFGKSLGYDRYSVVFMSYGSAVLGSSLSPMNPFAVLIAQKEADLPLLSGYEFRLIFMIVAFVFWVWFLLRYSSKNRIEPELSSDIQPKISPRSIIIISMLILTFAVVIYGLLSKDWGFNEISASFFILGILAGLTGKMNLNKTCETYIDGFKEMIFAAILVGLANSVSLLLKEGYVIDTIVQALFGPLKNFSPAISGVIMMFSHSILHFPMPSYSGQAILTMPILIPLSDLIGLSRQICVFAYQVGAVMMDGIVPTNGALMAIISVAGIPYNKWIAFIVKPIIIILILASVAIFIAVSVGI